MHTMVGMQRRILLWAFAPYALVSIVHVIARFLESDVADPTKLLLMPLLLVPVLVRLKRLPVLAVVLLIVALVFSWLGDGAGALFPSLPELPLMLGFFGLAHIAYLVLFLKLLGRGRVPWWALVYAAWWIGMLIGLGPHIGSLLIAVAVYGLLLAGTATTAARCHPIVAWGGAFFLASDTILAFRLFLPEAMPAWTSGAVMLTYTLGQGLIVFGALISLRKDKTLR